MRPQLARLGKQTLIYGVGGVLLPLVGLLTLPVFARVFQTDEYGVIDLVTVAMAVAALLVDEVSPPRFSEATSTIQRARRRAGPSCSPPS